MKREKYVQIMQKKFIDQFWHHNYFEPIDVKRN